MVGGVERESRVAGALYKRWLSLLKYCLVHYPTASFPRHNVSEGLAADQRTCWLTDAQGNYQIVLFRRMYLPSFPFASSRAFVDFTIAASQRRACLTFLASSDMASLSGGRRFALRTCPGSSSST
eukprot:TRINITY_DN7930_c0_g1_i1.p2 TRINITY_DN7930_c0_g1~~TRINITY_DN7930_c0_g1_i1.p2  ORF type:complete len:125 (+),score=2.49 TRINITY_DN7930_c0_g1_i1:51-425(+)